MVEAERPWAGEVERCGEVFGLFLGWSTTGGSERGLSWHCFSGIV